MWCKKHFSSIGDKTTVTTVVYIVECKVKIGASVLLNILI